MARMRADPRMQDWWRITDPMQTPLETAAEGEWWARIEPVFHHD
jgi:L-rhamnose mutarotase